MDEIFKVTIGGMLTLLGVLIASKFKADGIFYKFDIACDLMNEESFEMSRESYKKSRDEFMQSLQGAFKAIKKLL